MAACTCVLFCRWFLGEWVSERESLGFQRDAIQNILCIPIHESERPFKFHYDFQHLDCWTALKMNTNSLYGLAHSIYTYITKLLLSIVFWIFSRKKIKEVAKTRILPSFLFYFYNHFVSFPFSFCKQRSNRNIYRRYKQNIYDMVLNGRTHSVKFGGGPDFTGVQQITTKNRFQHLKHF